MRKHLAGELLLLILSLSACESITLKKAGRDVTTAVDSSKNLAATVDSAAPVASPTQLRGRDSVNGLGRSQNPNPLLAAIEAELRKVKPDIQNTRLVSLVPAPGWGDTMTYAVIARGRGPHRGWKRVEDIGEIYGVFWVDSTLTRASAPIDIFPSRRVGDYDVWLQRAWGSHVIVCAEGGSYGDVPMRREIETEISPDRVRKVVIDTAINDLERKGDAPCGSSGPKGD